MLSHWLKFKTYRMILSKCAVCNSKKSRFIKVQESVSYCIEPIKNQELTTFYKQEISSHWKCI